MDEHQPLAEIGHSATLRVNRIMDFGFFLEAFELGEILLPRKYGSEDMEIGDEVDVFLYLDSEDRPVATTERPLAMVGDFANLKVVSTTAIGAFLDWGLAKDLFVPLGEQRIPMEEGKSYTVYIMIDDTGRIAASSRLKKYISTDHSELTEGQEVELLIHHKTRLGYQVIFDNRYRGALYENEIFQPLRIGQRLNGFIKKIREDEKVDLCLQRGGYEHLDEVAETILKAIKANSGELALTDKSSPEDIKRRFGISKKRYKMALGKLYKERLIKITEDKILAI